MSRRNDLGEFAENTPQIDRAILDGIARGISAAPTSNGASASLSSVNLLDDDARSEVHSMFDDDDNDRGSRTRRTAAAGDSDGKTHTFLNQDESYKGISAASGSEEVSFSL